MTLSVQKIFTALDQVQLATYTGIHATQFKRSLPVVVSLYT